MERTQFTFYDSFYRAIKRIKKAADRAMAYDVICAYALNGEEPDTEKLPDSVAIAFEMIKPNLDASRRKAESGKRGGEGKQTGSKPEANRKQTVSKAEANRKQEKEQEKEKEQDKEQMLLSPVAPLRDTDTGKVFSSYLDRVNPNASQTSLDELKMFIETCGPDVCLRAIDIAVDDHKASWSYIKAILRDKAQRGVKSLADWDKAEQERQASKPSKGAVKNHDREDLSWMKEYM